MTYASPTDDKLKLLSLLRKTDFYDDTVLQEPLQRHGQARGATCCTEASARIQERGRRKHIRRPPFFGGIHHTRLTNYLITIKLANSYSLKSSRIWNLL